MKEITVIIPTFNRAKFLTETIESVLTQGNFSRVIVIDDGSTDNTDDIAAAYEGKLEWLKQSNKGEVKTVNRGLRLVDTPFFTIVNSDDPLLPGSLPLLLGSLDKNPSAIAAYCDWIAIDEMGHRLHTVRIGPLDLRRMLAGTDNPVGPGAIFRSTVLESVGYRNPLLTYSADLDYWHRVALVGEVVYVPKFLATHRVHPTSASVSEKSKKFASEIVYLKQAYLSHPKNTIRGLRKQGMCAGHYCAAFACSNPQDAAREFVRAFSLSPMDFLQYLDKDSDRMLNLLATLGSIENGRGRGHFEAAINASTRRKALYSLSRGIRHDPLGMISLARAFGSNKLRNLIRSRPLGPISNLVYNIKKTNVAGRDVSISKIFRKITRLTPGVRR